MKKKIKLLAAVILCTFVLQTCTSTSKKEENASNARTITIDLDQQVETKSLQDVVSSVTAIGLEESGENPIGIIDKMIITNTNIYILDGQRSKSLFIYDRKGKLKNVIRKVGTGPGEFVRPDDFDIQKSSGNLFILDGNQRKILIYNKNGDFISDLKFEIHINSFLTASNNNIILNKANTVSDRSNNQIRIVDAKGNTVTEHLPIPEYSKEITICPRNPLQKFYNDTILYMPSLNDKIYQIHGDEISLRYQLNFGKYWPGNEYFEKERGKHPLKIAQSLVANDYAAFFNYLETKDVLHVNFDHKHKPVSFYYNKKSGTSLLFSPKDENLSFPLTVDGTSFVCAIYFEDRNPTLIFYDIITQLK
jgi:outer membrane murein-binding lipoprotein Lpp